MCPRILPIETMAKSIRSKVKKRNRTEMRKTVGDPHQKMLQARCTAKILNSVGYGSGESQAVLSEPCCVDNYGKLPFPA